MQKKVGVFISAAMLFSSLSIGNAFAFNDVDSSDAAAVNMLKDRGIVSGVDADHFVPKGKISYAESVQLLVKAFGYNLDTMRFDHQPVASEFFTNIDDHAWYAEAFVIAHYHGLDIPKDVNPTAAVTREQFAYLLDSAFEKKAMLPMINLKMELKDDVDITPGFQGSVLRLVHYNIADLDKEGKFNPKAELTRGESARWTYNALQFISNVKPPVESENIDVKMEAVNNDVSKVTLTREQKQTGGYTITINSIRFKDAGHAVIQYSLQDPAPDAMATEVITQPSAVTYLPSNTEIELEQSL